MASGVARTSGPGRAPCDVGWEANDPARKAREVGQRTHAGYFTHVFHTRSHCPPLRLACLSDVVSQPVTLRPSLGVPEYRAARAGWRLDGASTSSVCSPEFVHQIVERLQSDSDTSTTSTACWGILLRRAPSLTSLASADGRGRYRRRHLRNTRPLHGRRRHEDCGSLWCTT